jgi:aspartate/methionine/tyrosine aminotransferase
VAVFAGGRPGIFATVSFLHRDIKILIEETEYTPYFDLLRLLNREHVIVPSNESNQFRPTLDDYDQAVDSRRSFVIKSNPCNPTGVTWSGEQLKSLVEFCSRPDHGGIIDEAYEFFFAPQPVSAMRYIDNIDETNIFVIGAATKGLQVPGMRIGWAIAAKENIEIFRNYSSIAMGGVARPSQIYVTKLLERDRVTHARQTVSRFYGAQRDRYRTGLSALGLELFTGDGGFYHWSKLPGGLTASELNERLFKHQAGILPGKLCDMKRRGDEGPLGEFIRFSFGPLEPESLEENLSILKSCLG